MKAEQNHYVWIKRTDDGRMNDNLKIAETDELRNHAPAWIDSKNEVEFVGTFKEFADTRDEYDLNLPKYVGVDGDITAAIGQERLWSVVWGNDG